MKPLTRAQMRRAAMAIAHIACDSDSVDFTWYSVARQFGVPIEEINGTNPRLRWYIQPEVPGNAFSVAAEASMLLSEANRPLGHDGDGK